MTVDYDVKVTFTDEEKKILKRALEIAYAVKKATFSYDCINRAAELAVDGISYMVED